MPWFRPGGSISYIFAVHQSNLDATSATVARSTVSWTWIPTSSGCRGNVVAKNSTHRRLRPAEVQPGLLAQRVTPGRSDKGDQQSILLDSRRLQSGFVVLV
jgi:hypothetical protein